MGRLLGDVRREQRLTQLQVGERLGMTGVGYSNYESGRATISSTNLPKIARALGVKPAYLIRRLGLVDDDGGPEWSEDEEIDLARLDPQFKDLMFATGRKYVTGSDAEKRTYLNILKALAGEEYREPVDEGV